MVVFYTNKASEHRWRVVEETEDGGEEILNTSTEGFATPGGARNNLLVAYSLIATYLVAIVRDGGFGAVEFYIDEDNKSRWRVTAKNGEIVAAAHMGFATDGEAKNNLLITYTLISTYLAGAAMGA